MDLVLDKLLANIETEKAEKEPDIQPASGPEQVSLDKEDDGYLDVIFNVMENGYSVSDLQASSNQVNMDLLLDKLLANMETEKAEQEPDIQPVSGLEQVSLDKEDGGSLDVMFNEMENGHSVSDLQASSNILSTVSCPSTIADNLSRNQSQDNTLDDCVISEPFSSPLCNIFSDNQLQKNGGTQTAVPVIMSYQLADQPVVIMLNQDNKGKGNTIPIQLCKEQADFAPTLVNNKIYDEESVKQTAPKPQPSGSRKRKLYEEDVFSDPEEEKKRQNAINARNHREKAKKETLELRQQLKAVQEEREACHQENEKLRKENDELKRKYNLILYLLK